MSCPANPIFSVQTWPIAVISADSAFNAPEGSIAVISRVEIEECPVSSSMLCAAPRGIWSIGRKSSLPPTSDKGRNEHRYVDLVGIEKMYKGRLVRAFSAFVQTALPVITLAPKHVESPQYDGVRESIYHPSIQKR